MDQRPGQHPGDDFGVAMGMVGIASTGAHHVVIVDEQRTEGDIAWVIMLAEGEAVVSFGPIRTRNEALPGTTQFNIWRRAPRRTHSFSICSELEPPSRP